MTHCCEKGLCHLTRATSKFLTDLNISFQGIYYETYYYDTADLVTFTEEILNGKLHFLCSVRYYGSYRLIY